MTQTFHGLKLEGLVCALPKRTHEVKDFTERFGEAAVARFQQVVGVERFHEAPPGMRTSDLVEAAAKHLFAQGVVTPEAIDVLLFVSQTPDAIAPATSATLQQRLGLKEELVALDINQGCAGFLAGLQTAANFLLSPTVNKVLLVGGDVLTPLVDPDDSASAMLFGDGAFAAVIGKDEAAGELTFRSNTASSDAIEIPHGGRFHMAGSDVFNFTITRVPEQLTPLLDETTDLVLLHQANAFIVRQVARMCRLPEAKVPCRIAQRGNTSSASLPLLICDLAAEGVDLAGKHALLSAFGVGLTWISAKLTLSAFPTAILEIES